MIGMGGISTPADVVEFMLAGATAVKSVLRVTGIRARQRRLWTAYSNGVTITTSRGLRFLGGICWSNSQPQNPRQSGQPTLPSARIPDRSRRFVIPSFTPHRVCSAFAVNGDTEVVSKRKAESVARM